MSRHITAALDPGDAQVDVFAVPGTMREEPDMVATQRLMNLADLFRGAFLEGLDLPNGLTFQAWRTAGGEEPWASAINQSTTA